MFFRNSSAQKILIVSYLKQKGNWIIYSEIKKTFGLVKPARTDPLSFDVGQPEAS
jgi:hypothetical protein